MNVILIDSTVGEQNVADTQAALDKLFQELDREQPDGVRYAAVRLSDGVTFRAVLILPDGANPLTDNPMRALPAYTELLDGLTKWRVGQVAVEQMTLLGSYRLF